MPHSGTTPSDDSGSADTTQDAPSRLSIDALLRTTPLLAGLDRASQDSLIWRFHPRPFAAGDRLIQATDTGRDLVVLLDGFAEVFARTADQRYLIAVLDPGSVMGEVSFFDPDARRTADVVAATAGMAALLPRSVYDELVEDQHPAAAALERAVLQAVSLRMQYTNETLAELLDTHKSGALMSSLARIYDAGDAP